jgi:voltage-gated potassium channel
VGFETNAHEAARPKHTVVDLVVTLILVFTISWGVLLAEKSAPNAHIKTSHEAVWWAFVTITTVGYGDYYPVTGWGQFWQSL